MLLLLSYKIFLSLTPNNIYVIIYYSNQILYYLTFSSFIIYTSKICCKKIPAVMREELSNYQILIKKNPTIHFS